MSRKSPMVDEDDEDDEDDEEGYDQDGDYGDDDDFDYDQFVNENFGSGMTNTQTRPLWRFVAVVLLVIFGLGILTQVATLL
jgi:RNA-splicing ligase RtcB